MPATKSRSASKASPKPRSLPIRTVEDLQRAVREIVPWPLCVWVESRYSVSTQYGTFEQVEYRVWSIVRNGAAREQFAVDAKTPGDAYRKFRDSMLPRMCRYAMAPEVERVQPAVIDEQQAWHDKFKLPTPARPALAAPAPPTVGVQGPRGYLPAPS